jgi:hypothetical protein
MIRSCSVIYTAHITHTNNGFQRVDLMCKSRLFDSTLNLLVARAFVSILVVLYQHNSIFRCTPYREGSRVGLGVVQEIVFGPGSTLRVLNLL